MINNDPVGVLSCKTFVIGKMSSESFLKIIASGTDVVPIGARRKKDVGVMHQKVAKKKDSFFMSLSF